LWLSLIVLLPLAAVISRSFSDGLGHFFDAITDKEAVAAIKLTLISSLIVVAINATMGTLIAWVLVRDNFPGKRLVNSVIDLPFALPTIVASLVLLALYGPNSPIGIHAAYTRVAVVMALLFVTLPFVIRAVQPVLMEVDQEMEEAAASLGAPNRRIFRSILLPNLAPAIIAGSALAFARAVGEFGSLVLLTGNVPFKTQAASVYIYGRVQTSDYSGAAAVSVLLLAISVGVLLALSIFGRWRSRHERS
jgi:sulfate/thiosulfate transport system permease protein